MLSVETIVGPKDYRAQLFFENLLVGNKIFFHENLQIEKSFLAESHCFGKTNDLSPKILKSKQPLGSKNVCEEKLSCQEKFSCSKILS